MKILALRVAAFRRFTDPAAIEDFAEGVNALADPQKLRARQWRYSNRSDGGPRGRAQR